MNIKFHPSLRSAPSACFTRATVLDNCTMSAILRHVMHLIIQSSINHPSVLQHSLCVLLQGFDFLLSQTVTVLKTDLYLHTQRLECSIVRSCASSAAHRCSSNVATASDTLSRVPHRSNSLVFISNLTENRSALSCMFRMFLRLFKHCAV